jgi:hypothetical protein
MYAHILAYFLGAGWDWVHLVSSLLFGLLYHTWAWSSWWNENWQGKPKYSKKSCLSATLSTTDPPWPDLRSNWDHHGEKLATNCLSYGMVCMHT